MPEEHIIPPDTGQSDKTGWNWFDQAEEQVNKARQNDGVEREDIQYVYASVFRGKGKVVLQDMQRFVTNVAGFDPNLGFYNGAAYGFYMEGMKAMALYIQRMVEQGKKPKIPKEETTNV